MLKGYLMISRSWDKSWIAAQCPCVRETFFYLLRNANHRPVDLKGGLKIGRGQLLRRYEQIIDDLSWHVGYRRECYSEDQMKKAMKALTTQQMITLTKTLAGMLITICNYDRYQTPETYEDTNEDTNEDRTTAPTAHQCTPHKNKNEKNEKNIYPPMPPAGGENGATSSAPSRRISFDYVLEKFVGIEEGDLEKWRELYPAVVLETELPKIGRWLLKNPTRRKKNVFRYIDNWLAKEQERGGSNRHRRSDSIQLFADELPKPEDCYDMNME